MAFFLSLQVVQIPLLESFPEVVQHANLQDPPVRPWLPIAQ
jgi:hypothetical protein